MTEFVRVGHYNYGLAHLDDIEWVGESGSTWGALCGVEFDPGPGSVKWAEGKPLCGACREVAERKRESVRQG